MKLKQKPSSKRSTGAVTIRTDLIVPLLTLLPLILGSVTEARKHTVPTVTVEQVNRACGSNIEWTPDEQKALGAELAPLPTSSLIRGKLAPDWLRMRDKNRACRGEKVPTK